MVGSGKRVHLGSLAKQSRIAERRIHESGHGVQERGSGCRDNGDPQVWL